MAAKVKPADCPCYIGWVVKDHAYKLGSIKAAKAA
jgi:hypothetical protein